VRVDQDVVDGVILQQRFDGTEAGHLVQDVIDKLFELGGIEDQTFICDVLGDEGMDLRPQFPQGYLFDGRKIDLVDDAPVDAQLGIEQALALGIGVRLRRHDLRHRLRRLGGLSGGFLRLRAAAAQK